MRCLLFTTLLFICAQAIFLAQIRKFTVTFLKGFANTGIVTGKVVNIYNDVQLAGVSALVQDFNKGTTNDKDDSFNSFNLKFNF